MDASQADYVLIQLHGHSLGGRWGRGKGRSFTYLGGTDQNLDITVKSRPHLAGRGKSHGFSRVAAGTWGIFSRYSGDVHSKL